MHPMRHPLVRFTTRRLLVGVLLCFGITLITFTLTNLVPGDPVAANLSDEAMSDPEIVAVYRESHGLDEPPTTQYLRYLERLAHGDLGTSMQSGRPVLTDLREKFPATLELTIVAMVAAVVVGVGFGLVGALTRDRLPDQVIRVVSLAGSSTPIFWLALLAFYVFYYQLGILPGIGRLDPDLEPPPFVTGLYLVDSLLAGRFATFVDALQHLLLPAGVLAAYAVGVFTRFSRAAVLESLTQEYVLYARTKGLPARKVVGTHVMRPALLSIMTLLGVSFASLLAGTVLIEQIFSWPGLGKYAYGSAVNLDLPAIMGVTLLVAVIFILTNLVVDILAGIVDPRIRVR